MKTDRFTFLCNRSERKAIFELATYYHLSQSDVIRLLVHNATKRIQSESLPQSSLIVAEPGSEISKISEEK